MKTGKLVLKQGFGTGLVKGGMQYYATTDPWKHYPWKQEPIRMGARDWAMWCLLTVCCCTGLLTIAL